ncbi:hypothetical protein H8D04_01515 [bacterium]|nr:hypothetical protein [bacterium]
MPYTKKELLTNEFWQRLHEQDRVDYQKLLEQAETFKNATEIVDEDGNVIPINKTIALRNDVGTFLSFEDPDTELTLEQPNQYISINKKSPQYHYGELWNKVLNREIKELI